MGVEAPEEKAKAAAGSKKVAPDSLLESFSLMPTSLQIWADPNGVGRRQEGGRVAKQAKRSERENILPATAVRAEAPFLSSEYQLDDAISRSLKLFLSAIFAQRLLPGRPIECSSGAILASLAL